MKIKIVLTIAFLTVTSVSVGKIIINESLSLEGFIDMAYTHLNGEADVSGSSNLQESDNSFGIEEVEFTFLFNFDPVTALIDLEFEENGEEPEVEQAFVNYRLDGNLQGAILTAGRYASMLGFEAFERVGRYQFSAAYEVELLGDFIGENLFNGILSNPDLEVFLDSEAFVFFESVLFPVGERYSQGVRYTYENDTTFFAVSIQDGTLNYENRLGGDDAEDDTAVDDGGYGIEIAYAYDCRSGFNYFIGGSYEKGDGINSASLDLSFGNSETYVINTYVTYEIGAWLFAVELNYSETEMDDVFASGDDADFESFTSLVMTNYVYNDQASITGRISLMDLNADLQNAGSGAGAAQVFKYTAAHNYAFTDNLLFVTELSYSEGDFHSSVDPDSDLEELFAAVQLLFVF